MAVDAEDAHQKLGAEAVHDGHDDDQRRDAQHDAEEGDRGDDRDERLLAARAQIAPRDHPLEGRERPGACRALPALASAALGHQAAPSRATTSATGSVAALAGAAVLDLDLAGRHAARPDDHLPGQADQVGGGELAAGALVGVVVEHVLAGRRQRAHKAPRRRGRNRRRRPSC